MVIVDRSIAFIGGIDLCYGHWDTRYHELMDNFDIHPAVDQSYALKSKLERSIERKYARWIGKDYRNTFHNKESQATWDKPTKVWREMRSLECRGMMSAALLKEKPYTMRSDISLTDTRVLCLGGRHFGARFK